MMIKERVCTRNTQRNTTTICTELKLVIKYAKKRNKREKISTLFWMSGHWHTHTNTPIYLDRKNSKVYTRFIRTYRGPLMILFCFLFHFVVHNNKRYYMGICLSHPTEVSRCVYRTHTQTHTRVTRSEEKVLYKITYIHTHI